MARQLAHFPARLGLSYPTPADLVSLSLHRSDDNSIRFTAAFALRDIDGNDTGTTYKVTGTSASFSTIITDAVAAAKVQLQGQGLADGDPA